MEEPNLNSQEAEQVQPTTDEQQPNVCPIEEVAEQPVEEAETKSAQDDAEPQKEEVFEEPVVDYAGNTREELVELMRNLLEEPIDHIRNRAGAMKNAFVAANKEYQKACYEAYIAEGGDKETYEQKEDAVAQSFHKLYNEYKERRQKRAEEIEAEKQANLEKKRALLEELRKVVDGEDSIKKMHDDFNDIQERWKQIGDIPRSEMNDLWQNYHFLVDQFYSKVRINKELKMLDLKKNLETKITLCEKAEELIVEPSIIKAFKEMQNLREQWKNVGPVPTEQNDEIWARFCNAADQVNARHREFFEKRKEEQEKNLLAKQALVEQAAGLVATAPTSAKQWNEVSNQLDELLKIWKTIGPVPREQNDEIWNTFKSSIDAFYAQKKEHFESVKDEQSENYNKKVDLCQKAEAIAQRDDWKKATQELLDLQAEWKKIGFVARKDADKIWKRFRAACDEFFARKAEFFASSHASEQENLEKKEALIEELRNYQFGEDKNENLTVIKDFQRQWMEIGHVPISEKERLQKEFRGIINDYFEKLKISAREAEENAYRDKIRNALGDTKFARNEKVNIMDKIEKLRADLSLWENNIGFLATSKQAELLKAEFEKKMQSNRQQIALLETKLRILRESEKKGENDSENAEA